MNITNIISEELNPQITVLKSRMKAFETMIKKRSEEKVKTDQVDSDAIEKELMNLQIVLGGLEKADIANNTAAKTGVGTVKELPAKVKPTIIAKPEITP